MLINELVKVLFLTLVKKLVSLLPLFGLANIFRAGMETSAVRYLLIYIDQVNLEQNINITCVRLMCYIHM